MSKGMVVSTGSSRQHLRPRVARLDLLALESRDCGEGIATHDCAPATLLYAFHVYTGSRWSSFCVAFEGAV
jgi:hypothetical protein